MYTTHQNLEISMAQGGNSSYAPTHEYTFGAPTRPHISLTPPPISLDESTDRQEIEGPASHGFAVGEFVCPGFFERVNLAMFTHKFEPEDWNYEMRRSAQPVLPFLYLGPSQCLKDGDFLRNEGITLLLAIRDRKSALARLVSGDKAAAELGIEADSVDVEDNQEFISSVPRAIRRINDHLVSSSAGQLDTSSQRKVLVFCESGNERSATVVVAYLMVMLNLPMAEAVSMAQRRRFSVCIEEQLRQMLSSFESILDAKRDVEKAKQTAVANSIDKPFMPISKKRSFYDRFDSTHVNDGDMDMGEAGDFPSNRLPLAPFQDR